MATEAEIAALYQKQIRKLAASVRSDRRLADADVSITKRSRVCGSSVTLDVRFQNERIDALGYRGRACMLGMAATALLVRIAPGLDASRIAAARDALAGLLAGDEVTMPEGWQALETFAAAIPFPSRHDSILLPFKAALAAFEPQAEAQPGVSVVVK